MQKYPDIWNNNNNVNNNNNQETKMEKTQL